MLPYVHQTDASCVRGRGRSFHLQSSHSICLSRNLLPSIIPAPNRHLSSDSLRLSAGSSLPAYGLAHILVTQLYCRRWSRVCVWFPPSLFSLTSLLTGTFPLRYLFLTFSLLNCYNLGSCFTLKLPQKIKNTHLLFCQIYIYFKANLKTKSSDLKPNLKTKSSDLKTTWGRERKSRRCREKRQHFTLETGREKHCGAALLLFLF